MPKIFFALLLSITILNCKPPKNKQFSNEVLNATLVNFSGDEVLFKEILQKHLGKTVMIDIWASWCGDCIKGLPKLNIIQQKFPDINYIFVSLDKNQRSWKDGIKRYSIKGEHYYVNGGWKSIFAENIDLDWIPRYIVINPAGKVVLYRAIYADDKEIIKLLENSK